MLVARALDAGAGAAYRCLDADSRSGRETTVSEADLTFLEGLAVLGGMILITWMVRRHIREHHQDLVAWWMRAVVPRARRWAVWIFIATAVLWAIVHVTAPDSARDSLGRQLHHLFATPPASDSTAPPADTTTAKPQ